MQHRALGRDGRRYEGKMPSRWCTQAKESISEIPMWLLLWSLHSNVTLSISDSITCLRYWFATLPPLLYFSPAQLHCQTWPWQQPGFSTVRFHQDISCTWAGVLSGVFTVVFFMTCVFLIQRRGLVNTWWSNEWIVCLVSSPLNPGDKITHQRRRRHCGERKRGVTWSRFMVALC